MEIVYTKRSGSIRSMPAQSETERQLTFERQQRARTEAELLEARQTVTSLRTRLAMAEAALSDCRAELETERARVAEPPTLPEPETKPKQARPVERPRKPVEEGEAKPVRWWAKGSKWDKEEE